MKKILFGCLILFLIFEAYPHPANAFIISPPPSCNSFPSNSTTRGQTLTFRGQAPQYQNGLLVIPLKFSSSTNNRDFHFTGTLLRSNDCEYMDSVFDSVINIPAGISDISIRFINDSSFKFYDDTTNVPLTCGLCDISLIPGDVPPYKFQIFLNTDFNTHSLESKPFEVEDPNFQPAKNPVLIIPGTLATDIYKGSELLWLDILKLVETNNDRFLDPLSFNDDGTPLDTSLTLGQVLEMPDVAFDYSKALVQEFASQNYIKNQELYLFPYDWRKDIAENANGPLKQKIDSLVQNSATGKVDIVAHSQGGLLIKRLLYDQPEYKDKIGKLIFVGTPHLGSPKSFKVLREGDEFSIKYRKVFGLDPEEIIRIVANMPSLYQMLPTKEYFNHYPGYWGELDRHVFSSNEEILYNYDTTKQKLKDEGYNATLLDNNDAFHTFDYDQFNFTDSGIEVYNIVGCQTPTYAGYINKSSSRDNILWEPGDETVPLKSATNVVNVPTFYVPTSTHSTMLTQDGIRQKIVNLITGSSLPTNGVTNDIGNCHFNGQAVSAHSPVDLHIYDQSGRHAGPTQDGGFDSEIPNLGYEIIGEEKFAFLPEGNSYTVELDATAGGSFSFYSSTVNEGQTTNTAYYDSVPIIASSTAEIILNSSNNQTIQLDSNGDGTFDQTIQPSSILDANQSQDLTPPISTSTLTGLMGQAGFYRGDVNISLSSADPVITGQESQTSGVLKTSYKLDANPSYQTYNGPIIVTDEDRHTISFFSTDRAGNNETEQTVVFTIDKTAAEFLIQFNPLVSDLQFTGADNISTTSAISVLDRDDAITLTDQAGNQTQIKLKEKERKKKLKAEIKSISYNGQLADISKNKMAFDWKLDKQQNLKELNQHVKSKKDFNIDALYKNGKTTISGKDQSGKIKKTILNLVLLKITTTKGDLDWSY